MIRKIIKIDEEKCTGCGLCASACHEGAIEMIHGKAKLTRENYCDGLGGCLPACPADAISFEEREAPAYNEAAVKAAKEKQKAVPYEISPVSVVESRLTHWPVQLKLVPNRAPYFDGADLLIAADCTAYAYGNFHNEFIHSRAIAVGCPKLDNIDYAEKLAQILMGNEIKSVTVVRMEVPCCGRLEDAVKRALRLSRKSVPWDVVTISTNGKKLNN